MHLTYREWWSLVHGFVFGGGFLLSFAGVAIVLYGLRRQDLTDEGIAQHVLWLRLGSAAMAAAAWGTVILGTWVIYPWYRVGSASPKAGCRDGTAVLGASVGTRIYDLSSAIYDLQHLTRPARPRPTAAPGFPATRSHPRARR